MVPERNGGCTFTLQNGRCPFLNDKNLCDLYTELGEDKLCDTCAEFPRFINEYGSEREIGIAPSCKTAGELMFGFTDSLTFTVEENDEQISSYNDIDPQVYFKLRQARITAYGIIRDRNFTIEQRCMLYLDFAKKIQKKMDTDRLDLADYEIKAYSDKEYLSKRIKSLCEKYKYTQKSSDAVCHFFDEFPDMEVINPDWWKVLERHKKFFESKKDCQKNIKEFMAYYSDRQTEYEQLMMYYVYRYFLNAVYDEKLLLKAKIGVIGFLMLRQLDVEKWKAGNGELSFTEQVDLAHLYSRQFEHSYTNFEVYNTLFETKRIYSYTSLMELCSYL
jgi:lysine-N-methylase